MVASAIDFAGIRRLARSRAHWSDRWEDVAQTASLLAIQRPETHPALLVIDALRLEFGHRDTTHRAIRRAGPLTHPERLASHYPTQQQELERWMDEETEDQVAEWRGLQAAERDRRIIESHRALGSSGC